MVTGISKALKDLGRKAKRETHLTRIHQLERHQQYVDTIASDMEEQRDNADDKKIKKKYQLIVKHLNDLHEIIVKTKYEHQTEYFRLK